MEAVLERINISDIACAVPKYNPSIYEYAADILSEKDAKRVGRGTGFKRLRIVSNDITTADLCCCAAKEILMNVDKDSIDGLVFVTQTPDYILPATSHVLQERLGLSKKTFCLDINQGCAGWEYGMYVSSLLVSTKQCKSVLLLAGDTISKITSKTDRATRCIFGDAGTATLITPGSQTFSFKFSSYGERSDAIIVENSRHRKCSNPKNDGYLFLDGMGIMNFTLEDVPNDINELLAANKLNIQDISLFACHQANKLILTTLADKLGVGYDVLPFMAENIGNTSSASIPLTLVNANKELLNKVYCCGFGVGLTVGSCIGNFSATNMHEVIEL